MIEFARTHVIGRSSGHSSVKAAAYRSGTRQYDQRNGLTSDYSHRVAEVAHSEILLPDGAPAALRERNRFWNEVEFCEDKHNRRDQAQLAKDHIIALPRELALEQQIELDRDFAQHAFVDAGVGVDLNVHLHSQDNPHAHLMVTTRTIDENGLGAKARHLNGNFFGGQRLPEAEQLRHRWAQFQNGWCADRGIDLLVTNNDGQWQAESHHGPRHHMDEDLEQPVQTQSESQAMRVEAIESDFGGLIDRVAKYKAVFSAHDLYRELFKHIPDAEQFQISKVLLDQYLNDGITDPDCSLVRIGSGPGRGQKSGQGRTYYTTQETIDTELQLKQVACEMFQPSTRHDRVTDVKRTQVVERDFDFLSVEQKTAVEHVTSSERLSIVVGLAGAGKSTLLKAAGKCWRSTGSIVRGVALAGIAAEGLEKSAGIKSTTIHSLLLKLDRRKTRLMPNDVIVVDEAGMIDSKLMLTLANRVNRAGAKLVLVGDPDQLQSIQAGSPLRSMASQGGFCEVSTIRRQQSNADRQATFDLARGQVASAYHSYLERGHVTSGDTVDAVIDKLVRDAVADLEKGSSTAVLAHANRDVKQLNASIRDLRIKKGQLANECTFGVSEGQRIEVGQGDRILFRRNDHRLGVKNGSLGTVISAQDDFLEVQIDEGDIVGVHASDYDQLSHGYAMTVHKSQGITVDQTRVLVTDRWDRHLSYVGMSRHKAHLQLYVSRELEDPVNVMQRTRVQENALEFAQRQGIDITRALPAVKRPVEAKKAVTEKTKSVRPELQPERPKKAVLRTQDKPRGRGR